jgi:hypothetical protein
MGNHIPFASVVPQSVAQQLTLARFRREIQHLGKDRFQQQVSQDPDSTQIPTWIEWFRLLQSTQTHVDIAAQYGFEISIKSLTKWTYQECCKI